MYEEYFVNDTKVDIGFINANVVNKDLPFICSTAMEEILCLLSMTCSDKNNKLMAVIFVLSQLCMVKPDRYRQDKNWVVTCSGNSINRGAHT